MDKQMSLFSKTLVVGVIVLLTSMSVVSSTENIVKNPKTNYQPLESFDMSKELLFRGKIAYAWNFAPNGPCYFYLDDPGDITQFFSIDQPILVGGTWTNDGRWLCCDYNCGVLWEIDPETGNFLNNGGGGTSLNGLAYNPIDNKLYGASSDGSSGGLFEIDQKTGEQTYIGSFVNTAAIIGIACDAWGTMYGWDVVKSGESRLWMIDIDTGQATEIGPLGISLYGAQDGAFDLDTDILYLTAWVEDPVVGAYLYTCDKHTGNCTLIGEFEENAELAACAIPYNWSNHSPSEPIIDGPTRGRPGITYYYNFTIEEYDGGESILEIDWGDGNKQTELFDPYPAQFVTVGHFWTKKGTYRIKARYRDEFSWWSYWGELMVIIPRDRILDASLFLKLFGQSPFLEVLLRIMNLLR